MLQSIKNFLHQMFTEDDNESADLIPMVAFAGNVTYLGLYIYLCGVKGTLAFNGTEFGTGFGVMLGAYGLAFKLKRDAQVKPMAGDAAVDSSGVAK